MNKKDNSVKKFIIPLIMVSILSYSVGGLNLFHGLFWGALIGVFFYIVVESYLDK